MNKVFVFGLDGMPYRLYQDLIKKDLLPHTSSCMNEYRVKEIESVIPVVSSVAWTSFSTGADPSEHGIYGFVERDYRPFHLRIPLSYDINKPVLWQELSEFGKKVAVINVPISYPAYPVNGVLVSCFLCPDMSKAAYPDTVNKMLKEQGYIIDADASLVRNSKEAFIDHILLALEKRFEAANYILNLEDWDYFHLHIMETDRLMHFFWYDIFNTKSPFHKKLNYFFKRLDILLAGMLKKIPVNASSVIISDHGFCGIKYEVQINKWLEEEGWLKLTQKDRLESLSEDSICYSLLPGRIFINLQGREDKGFVSRKDYNDVCDKIIAKLKKLVCPYTGEVVIDKVYLRKDIYEGPYADNSADITLLPRDGYDLKSSVGVSDVFTKSDLTGMHTLKNALLCGKNIDISHIRSIKQIAPTIKQHISGG